MGFIPGITGPFRGSLDPFSNMTVKKSSQRIRSLSMNIKTSIKEAATDNPARLMSADHDDNNDKNEISNSSDLYWDGGLCNNWPKVDDSTWIVSPLNGDYSPNLYIAPE